MPPPLSPTFGRPERSNAFAHERDARVQWLLDMHPVTAAMLVSLGWFPTKDKALKRLRRLVQKRRIRLVGTVARFAGRPEHVYCRWRPKGDHLLHEVQLTELCLRLDAGTILRGPHVADRRILPDAEVWINGQTYYLELDRGTMSYGQIEGRFRKYEECRNLSLWVCDTKDRLEGLRRRAARLRHTALFTTFDNALATPHGPIWVDHLGEKASLPHHS